MKKTTVSPKISEVVRDWILIDAKDKVLGQLAVKTADMLRGKTKVIFAPHVDCGDHIIIINAKHIVLTGNKWKNKEYHTHSRTVGHLKTKTAEHLRETNPEKIIFLAVKGMIPHNKLRKNMLERLRIFPEAEHTHTAQQPKIVNI